MLRQQLEALNANLEARGFDVRPMVFMPPAVEAEVRALEAELSVELPPSLRNALLKVSSHVEFRWFSPKGVTFQQPFQSTFSGDLHWSLALIRQFNQAKDSWLREVFPNADDPYDAIWHNKLAFFEVGNGDYLSLDLAAETYEQVVYLSHDDGEGHGYVLAENFGDLLRRWVPIACAGGDDWQWLPFTNGKSTMIDPESTNAIIWRGLLGLAT